MKCINDIKCYYFFLLVCFFGSGFSQYTVTNPVTKETEVVLLGNTIIGGSSKNEYCNYRGVEFQKFAIMACGTGDYTEEPHVFSDISIHDSILNVRITANFNCCKDVLADLELIDDSTLNLIYIDFGESCVCECNFCMDYQLRFSPSRINRLHTRYIYHAKIKYLMINHDPKTRTYVKELSAFFWD